MKSIKIIFSANGTISQTIRLDEEIEMTPDQFLTEMKSGNIVTSILCTENKSPEVYQLIPFRRIGAVINMEAFDDMEYRDFELVTEDEEPEPTISMTYRAFANRFGMTDKACEIVGLNPYCLNEGQVSETDSLTITLSQAKKLGMF